MPEYTNPPRLKLLCIAGSPRRGGNTDRLLNEAVAGAAGKGVQVKQVVLSDLEIAPCQHCDGCIQMQGRCVIEDDMQDLHQELREFDRFILASPIFFMGITAQSKTMIDRCQALWVMKYLMKLPIGLNKDIPRKGAFISVGATSYGNLFDGSKATVNSWYKTLDVEYTANLLIPGIDDYNAVSKHPTAMKDAFALGQQMAV
ncbi:MAG: flavodoxin family protein [Dehalococcoidia bacterium]|nr:MAG: flavodoxin family protein [Dehalococcoidia bacterium]